MKVFLVQFIHHQLLLFRLKIERSIDSGFRQHFYSLVNERIILNKYSIKKHQISNCALQILSTSLQRVHFNSYSFSFVLLLSLNSLYGPQHYRRFIFLQKAHCNSFLLCHTSIAFQRLLRDFSNSRSSILYDKIYGPHDVLVFCTLRFLLKHLT